jgi:hypothetical protein
MLIKNVRNTLFIATFISSTIAISGCANSPALPIAKVQKDFKNDFDVKVLNQAIANAAKEKNWDIVNQTPTSISLKKRYQTQTYLSPIERWKRVTANNDIYANVEMNQKFFKINLSDKSEELLKTDSDRELLNEDIKNLEKAIYGELTEKLL